MVLRTRRAGRAYLLVAVRYVGFAAALVAPVAIGAGVAAGRLAGPGHTFAVVLGATVAGGFVSGLLVAPGLHRRIGWRLARSRAGRGPSGT